MFLVTKKWGHTNNVQDLAQFIADLGDSDLSEFMKQRVNYTSPTSVVELTSALSQYFEHKILSDLKGRKFTLFLDESTDNANRSQASLMARWLGNKGVQETFLGLVRMKGTKAVDFEVAVKDFCVSKGLDPKNIRFIALDGCNTMSGEKSGMLTMNSILSQTIFNL